MEAVGGEGGGGGGEGGRGKRRFGWGDGQRQTQSGGTDNERVMKQEIGRLEKENHARNTKPHPPHPEILLNPKNLVRRWSIRRRKKMAASYTDLINFEGSSAPLVQGRVQEGGREEDRPLG